MGFAPQFPAYGIYSGKYGVKIITSSLISKKVLNTIWIAPAAPTVRKILSYVMFTFSDFDSSSAKNSLTSGNPAASIYL